MLTLAMLVYTPKGNIPVVGNYMREHNLLLDHPTTTIFDCSRVAQCWYHNPHNPPPGGHNRQPQAASINPSYSGPGAVASRWNTPSAPGKSVEVQRSQAEELFKSLKSGDDLPETEPAPEVSTPLYPHQKKALTFLLEREREQASSEGHSVSLWQPRLNPFTGQTSWTHLVTQREAFSEPDEAKGAILADDVSLLVRIYAICSCLTFSSRWDWARLSLVSLLLLQLLTLLLSLSLKLYLPLRPRRHASQTLHSTHRTSRALYGACRIPRLVTAPSRRKRKRRRRARRIDKKQSMFGTHGSR